MARARSLLVNSLFLLVSPLVTPSTAEDGKGPPKTAGIQAIIAVDTLTGPAGAGVNEMRVLSLLEEIGRSGIEVKVSKIPAESISPGNIVAAIRGLDASRLGNRTLLFYFAGHGGTDPRSGHFLKTSSGDLSRSTLLAELRAKSPALTIVLTDCCSTRAKRNGPAPPAQAPPELRPIENLFLQHRGVVDINASSCHPDRGVYQAAFYHPAMGGLFTYAFTSMFEEQNPILEREPDDVAERKWPGSKEKFDYRRRFNGRKLSLADADGDGFLTWREFTDHLGGVLMNLYSNYKGEVRSGSLMVEASPRDIDALLSQVSQDIQVFGTLAVRSDVTAPEASTKPAPARPARLGTLLIDRTERGGSFVEITGVEPGSPAANVSMWRNSRRLPQRGSLSEGDTILRANNRRVRSREDLLRILDSIPSGGELNLSGVELKTGRGYEATVSLDRYSKVDRVEQPRGQ